MPSAATIVGADGTPEQVPSQSVTAGFFDVLGVTPLLGRAPAVGREPERHEVVVSEGFWRSRLGADRLPSAEPRHRRPAVDHRRRASRRFQLVPASGNAASTDCHSCGC